MKNIYLVLFIAILFFSACGNTVESPYAPIGFERVPSMPGNGRSSASAFVINGKGYVLLGRDSTNKTLSDCWEYNPAENIWLEKKSFPGVGRTKGIAAVVNEKAYAGLGYNPEFGVYNTGSNLTDFWMYDPTDDSWTQKESIPSVATVACVSFVYNNNVYIGGGFNQRGFTSEFWKYNPADDTWVRLNDFPSMKRAGSVLCASGEHVYYGTGYRTMNENDWWEYFPENDAWKKRKSMPDKGRVNGVALTIGNRYFVSTGRQFGGTLTGGHVKSEIFEYDALLDVWYERGNIPESGRENAISFTINGKGYIGFGENNEHVLNDLWSFEP
jgi:N-acetylneuraminic acid mutarotase